MRLVSVRTGRCTFWGGGGWKKTRQIPQWWKSARKRKRWDDNTNKWTRIEFANTKRAVEDREGWRMIVVKSSVMAQKPLIAQSWDEVAQFFCDLVVNCFLWWLYKLQAHQRWPQETSKKPTFSKWWITSIAASPSVKMSRRLLVNYFQEFQNKIICFLLNLGLFVACWFVLDDLPINGTLHTPTRAYKQQAGNGQSLSYKHWFNVWDYELHKSRNCAAVTRRQHFIHSSHFEIGG